MSSQGISLQAESITLAISLPSDIPPCKLGSGAWNDASLLNHLRLGENIILPVTCYKG